MELAGKRKKQQTEEKRRTTGASPLAQLIFKLFFSFFLFWLCTASCTAEQKTSASSIHYHHPASHYQQPKAVSRSRSVNRSRQLASPLLSSRRPLLLLLLLQVGIVSLQLLPVWVQMDGVVVGWLGWWLGWWLWCRWMKKQNKMGINNQKKNRPNGRKGGADGWNKKDGHQQPPQKNDPTKGERGTADSHLLLVPMFRPLLNPAL